VLPNNSSNKLGSSELVRMARSLEPSQLVNMSSVAAMIGKLDATAVAEQQAARERKLAGASSFWHDGCVNRKEVGDFTREWRLTCGTE
jgi:hypothetical protein